MNKLNCIRHIILYCLFLLLCLPSISLSIIYKITDNTASDEHPSLYDGKIAWESNVDGNLEIYYWDGTTTHRITNNTADDISPSLYEEKIAWSGDADGDWEIYYGGKCGIQQITSNIGDYDGEPSLYNGTIAWERNTDGSTSEIYYWNGASTRQISYNITDDIMPSLYNGSITWENNGEIYFWNDGTVTPENMTTSADYDVEPSLYNGKIAWTSESDIDGVKEIYFLDMDGPAIPVQITNNSGSEGEPSASLYETTIAWDSREDGDYEIYYSDGTETRKITDNSSEDWYPSLYNGKIAWQSDVDGDWEIYYWDGGTRVLVNAGYDQEVSACEIVSLDATNTFDPEGVIDIWTWLLEYRGDYSKDITAIGETATVSDLTAGIYDVTLTVTDNAGEKATDTILLEVDHNPWDVDNDCRKGLAEVISILQELTGQ